MTRAHLTAAAQRRPTVALAFCLAVLSIQSSFFATPGAPGRRLDLDADDVRELAGFQSRVQQCVTEVGVTLTAPTGKERAEGWAGLRGVRELTGVPQGPLFLL